MDGRWLEPWRHLVSLVSKYHSECVLPVVGHQQQCQQGVVGGVEEEAQRAPLAIGLPDVDGGNKGSNHSSYAGQSDGHHYEDEWGHVLKYCGGTPPLFAHVAFQTCSTRRSVSCW